jgi:hypothetical protein
MNPQFRNLLDISVTCPLLTNADFFFARMNPVPQNLLRIGVTAARAASSLLWSCTALRRGFPIVVLRHAPADGLRSIARPA